MRIRLLGLRPIVLTEEEEQIEDSLNLCKHFVDNDPEGDENVTEQRRGIFEHGTRVIQSQLGDYGDGRLSPVFERKLEKLYEMT